MLPKGSLNIMELMRLDGEKDIKCPHCGQINRFNQSVDYVMICSNCLENLKNLFTPDPALPIKEEPPQDADKAIPEAGATIEEPPTKEDKPNKKRTRTL